MCLSIPFTTTMSPQSSSTKNLASGSSSKPKYVSVNSSLSQIRHFSGHDSPHNPAHKWPHFSNFFRHGRLQRGRLQSSPHGFVHVKCSHRHWQCSWHTTQGSPHLFRHLLCGHSFGHGLSHGGQFFVQGTVQAWPQKLIRPHFEEHGIWRRPCLHFPQVPKEI